MADLYQDYRSHTEEERDRRTAVGKQRFFHRLLLELGEDKHRAQLKRVNQNHRDVFVQWKQRPVSE